MVAVQGVGAEGVGKPLGSRSSDVRFSNRPFLGRHFQAVRRYRFECRWRARAFLRTARKASSREWR
jgi:hypothetical protein